MKVLDEIKLNCVTAMQRLYNHDVQASEIQFVTTRKEFEGDYTLVLFPFLKILRKSPVELGNEIGAFLKEHVLYVESYNVASGFLNISFNNDFWLDSLHKLELKSAPSKFEPKGKKVLVEFSSPNTNKPLHLGHVRNILLGWSCAKLLEKTGFDVVRTQVINDRGIAICKSMLAWKKYGMGATPTDSGIKGDHFVGDFYVSFETHFQNEYTAWQASEEGRALFASKRKEGQSEAEFFKAFKNTFFNEYSVLGREAKDMLRDWENGVPEVLELWKQMNDWVYSGFELTYKALGVSFHDTDFESETYLLGKDIVKKGLESGTFYREADNSVWIDLEDVGLDKKIVLRSDGTAVYITQDIGTAEQRFDKYGMDRMIYVVADEQDYHFQVLFEIMKRLKTPYADGLYHLSYGMVDLPTGKMKSREGTVVDADDLIEEVIKEARSSSEERGELSDIDENAKNEIYRKVGLAALKYHILKVAPKKRMVFDPVESVDLQGQTGPYIQNAYVRINSIFRKGNISGTQGTYSAYNSVSEAEKALLIALFEYEQHVEKAAEQLEPSILANYVYELAKKYHKFYHDHRVITAETKDAMSFRISLSKQVGAYIEDAMEMLGIEMPERM